ncbi:MAG: L-seryl-tRNA(Sec) selenium transferase [Chloroflexi bacterium RBG_13_51_18]|nr:MAG: L-seryl-tRNA(Sec) selenium transferase [Chloroflexi bacterium RBG_13_51_18]
MEFRKLPGVDKILTHKLLAKAVKSYPHDLLVSVIREQLEAERANIAGSKAGASLDEIAKTALNRLEAMLKPSLRRVINAAGVILHTNLGRAPMSREALAAMEEAGRGYTNLEIDMESGGRGSRHVHVESLLCRLTGAGAAIVVNNNAAAVLLGLTALARRKKVIVSRGQAVEIGGGFRIPDVLRQSGAKLIEVGTTNCTYAQDFEQAIDEQTAALMRVHSSNFRLVGFTSEVTLEELVEIEKRHNLMVFDDLGSGSLLDTAAFGLAPEPMVQQSVKAGATLTFFSGDKLLGGPQAGIIVGEKQYIDKLKKHPLARAMRIDKTRLAGLAVTLIHYLKGEATLKIPVWQMIAAPLQGIEKRAQTWAKALGDDAKVVDGETMIGGGSLPGGSLPTKLVAIGGGSKKVQSVSRKLRLREVPVIGRIDKDVLLLDPRTVQPQEDELVINALSSIRESQDKNQNSNIKSQRHR